MFKNAKHEYMADNRCDVKSILDLVFRRLPAANWNILDLKPVLCDEVPTYGRNLSVAAGRKRSGRNVVYFNDGRHGVLGVPSPAREVGVVGEDIPAQELQMGTLAPVMLPEHAIVRSFSAVSHNDVYTTEWYLLGVLLLSVHAPTSNSLEVTH